MGCLDQEWFKYGWSLPPRIMVRLVHRVGCSPLHCSAPKKGEGSLLPQSPAFYNSLRHWPWHSMGQWSGDKGHCRLVNSYRMPLGLLLSLSCCVVGGIGKAIGPPTLESLAKGLAHRNLLGLLFWVIQTSLE